MIIIIVGMIIIWAFLGFTVYFGIKSITELDKNRKRIQKLINSLEYVTVILPK